MSTLFTQDSRKLYLAVSAVLVTGGLYAGIVLMMTALSTWAEQELHAFPFKEEDWLRYLLPAKFVQQDRDRIMLVGPSTVRENFLYERFEDEFPDYAVFQGGISVGTIDDATVSLEYVEKVYGEAALPDVVILGIAPRFIANIPDDRPFRLGIDRYSPYYSIGDGKTGMLLVSKGPLQALVARARFLVWKQPARFKIAMLAILNYWLSGEQNKYREIMNSLFKQPVVISILGQTEFKRAANYEFTEVLEWLISPYKYQLSAPAKLEGLRMWLTAPDSWWKTVHEWDPAETRQITRDRLKKFTDFVDRHGMQLMVVNLPERDVSRDLFDNEKYQAYLDAVRDSFGDVPFLDFRTFLRSDEFHDSEHCTRSGSLRLTNEVIRNIKDTLIVTQGINRAGMPGTGN